MEEKHKYTSNKFWGAMRFNLLGLKKDLLDYFNQDSTKVFHYICDFAPHNLYGYNQKGISVHIQEEKDPDTKEPRFIDITLLSEVTPTKSLEGRLYQIAQKHRKSN
jgi:hypothetical protein